MDNSAFPLHSSIHLPSHSRILRQSCCPDKDLVVLFSRMGGLERITMYNYQNGTKIWDADVGDEASSVSTHVVDLCWSPDGRSIALLLNPPSVSLHSIQDGHVTTSLPIELLQRTESPSVSQPAKLAGIWWFRSDKVEKPSVIPDIFRRHGIITGSTESILRSLPLLDPLAEESDNLTATNLFAFQGSQTRSQSKSQLPKAISTWPTLSADLKTPAVDSSIQTKLHSKVDDNLDETDDSNVDSVLMVTDIFGFAHCFLDGTFPLGKIDLGQEASFVSVEKSNGRPTFFGHSKFLSEPSFSTCLEPTIVDMPLLVNRKMRDLARLSSIARDLTWYIVRVVKEMKSAWYGSPGTTGARELGPKWVQSLKVKQTEKFGQKGTDPILDLTWLLTTGRASKPLEDFLGGGEQMSERGIQKWESIMSDALMKLRDYSEKRLVPACQRLQLVLEELQGWKMLPALYSMFDLDQEQLELAAKHTDRGIVLGSLLASVVRREHFRFKEFIAWLRFEATNAQATPNGTTPETNSTPRHDILAVNNYLISGLASSKIDMWFEGELDQFEPRESSMSKSTPVSLAETIRRAKIAAIHGLTDLPGQEKATPADHFEAVKNIVVLSEDLAERCNRVFIRAAVAATRSGNIVLRGPSRPSVQADFSKLQGAFEFRERIVQNKNQVVTYFLAPVKHEHASMVLVQMRQGEVATAVSPSSEIRVSVVECQLPEGEGKCSILAADFFDDESIIVVYRAQNDYNYLSRFDYLECPYYDVDYPDCRIPTWEVLSTLTLRNWEKEQVPGHKVILTRRRVLGGRSNEVGLAVNGRSSRRVVCVVDGTGTRLESVDLGDDAGEDSE